MKKLITILLMSICTASYAFTFDAHHYQDRVAPGYYYKTWDNNCGRTYVPMYQHPRFTLYSKCRPFNKDCNCRDILQDNHTGKHGMVRCYNHEGLSIEYYYR